MNKSRLKAPLSANVRKIILLLLRFVLPVAALAFLVRTLAAMPPEVHRLWLSSLRLDPLTILMLCLLLFLSAFNWLLEAMKWKILAGEIERISLGRAYRGILYGVCLGFVTPKRSGEIAGRALVLDSGNRITGMLVNTPGSMLQLGVTLVGGLTSLALVFYGWRTDPEHLPAAVLPATALLLFPVMALLLLILLFLVAKPMLRRFLARQVHRSWSRKASVLLNIDGPKLVPLAALSVCRYMVFMLQFYLLLRVFQAPLSFPASFVLLSLTYLVLTAVPLSALGEAGVRAAVVLLVAGWVTAGDLTALMETGMVAGILGLWLINLVVPALAGAALAMTGSVPLNIRRALT